MSSGVENIIAGLFMVGFIAGLIYLIYKLVRYFEKKQDEAFQKVGAKYGLKFEKDINGQYGNKKGPLLKGTIKGCEIVCYSYTTGGAKNQVYWTAFKLKHNLSVENYSLKLVNEHIFRKMGKGLGMVKEIEIGVNDFDNRYLINSENISTTRAILNKRNRDKISSIPQMYFGELFINEEEIAYKVPLQIIHEKTSTHFQGALDAAVLLLDELNRIYR